MKPDHLADAERLAAIAAEYATRVDAEARFPAETVAAARAVGLLGLVSATEVGGRGLGLRAAAEVVERVARECASSAMVLTMHYAGTFTLEAHGPEPVRRAIAGGHDAVQELVAQMDAGRRLRLRRLGFADARAAELSALHTRNFM